MEALPVLSDDGNLNNGVLLVQQQMDRNPQSTAQMDGSESRGALEENSDEQNFQCNICGRKYKSSAALKMHRSRNHGQKNEALGSIRCQEPSCITLVKTITELREHLTSAHRLQFKTMQTEFPTMKAFDRWKAQVEHTECVCFVMKKSKVTPIDRQRYFYCQKSALCSTNNKNVNCTAQLLVKENTRSGTISVTGCLTHYGHSMTTRQFIESISKRPRIKEGGVAGQDVDMSTVRNQLLAIYELAITKKKQKSVDKICAALRDLYDCLKDYDEDDETLPGLEETQAWRRTAAREVAEQERQAIAKSTL